MFFGQTFGVKHTPMISGVNCTAMTFGINNTRATFGDKLQEPLAQATLEGPLV